MLVVVTVTLQLFSQLTVLLFTLLDMWTLILLVEVLTSGREISPCIHVFTN